jgi:hypothetical protein
MSFRTRTMTVAALAAGLLAVSACSRSEPEGPMDDNALGLDQPMTNGTDDIAPVETPSAIPEPTPDANAAAAIEPPPEAPIKPDAQVLDDADATGMTARVTRDEAPARDETAAPNDQAPQ